MRTSRSAALREVTTKSDRRIERETALRWLTRAEACFVKYQETGACDWRVRAHSYGSEALEHAAQVRDHGRLVAAVGRRLRAAERAARRG